MPKIKKPQTLIQWGNEEVTALELFKELDRLVAQPVTNLYEMDGDMYLSDYRKHEGDEAPEHCPVCGSSDFELETDNE